MMAMDLRESSNKLSSSAKLAVLVLMGLPGSGKTTLCFSLPAFLGNKYHIIHICYDQVLPFKEDRNCEEKNSSWKSERAKIVQATETLICNLIGAKSSVNEGCTCFKEAFHHKTILNANVIGGCFCNDPKLKSTSGEVIVTNKNIADYIDSNLKEARHFNQNMNSSISLECATVSTKGHYTIVNSFNDFVSVCDKISECDLKNELFVMCVDDNCYYRSMRKEWWNLAMKYELPFCIVTLRCDVNVCVGRVRKRVRACTISPSVPENVIYRMDKHLEFPDGNLYPWEKLSTVIDSNCLNVHVNDESTELSDRGGLAFDKSSLESLNQIKQLIDASLLEPAKSLKKERQYYNTSVTTSITHAVDLALRKIVSKCDPSIRSQVNIKRKNILEDLKKGKLVIPSDILEEIKDGFGHSLDEYVTTLINLNYRVC